MVTKKQGPKKSTRMDKYRVEGSIKKGPWTDIEDQVLVNFVNKNGPKDWSSIRSLGLLPRTGKSCRLRWVNKLRPNLKVGCKFTAEEESIVIDLQARIGNKWASIAKYLPGRTDNDVKNFWSSRQKRLARILHSSSPRIKSSHKNEDKALKKASEVTPLKVIDFDTYKKEEQPCLCSSPVDTQIPPLMTLQDFPTPHLTTNKDSTFTYPYDQYNFITEANLLPVWPDMDFDLFASHKVDELDELLQFGFGSEFKVKTVPDNFFDELPADLFDDLEPYPSSSSLSN